MESVCLSYSEILRDGATYHLTRTPLEHKRPRQLHGHDFYELLWVQNGIMRHHTRSGHRDFPEGTLVFIRPNDIHGLQAKADETLVVSLTLTPHIMTDMAQRYPELQDALFWSDAPEPETKHREMRQLATLNHAALRLERVQPTQLELEAFLLPLLVELLTGTDHPSQMPDWLNQACLAAQHPDVFRNGAAGLVRLTGRAHPHVSRTMRRFLQQSPSEYINTCRMEYAAKKLSGTSDTLAEIATECGLPNMSHFHKLFRAHFGQTPQRYRRAHQKDVVQPAT